MWAALAMTLVFSGCGSGTPGEKLVREHLAAESGGKVKITEYTGPVAWTAADSLKILKDSLEREKASRIASLEKAIASSNKAIEGAQQVKEGGFSALDGMADQTIRDAEMTIAAAEITLVACTAILKGPPWRACTKGFSIMRTPGTMYCTRSWKETGVMVKPNSCSVLRPIPT